MAQKRKERESKTSLSTDSAKEVVVKLGHLSYGSLGPRHHILSLVLGQACPEAKNPAVRISSKICSNALGSPVTKRIRTLALAIMVP